MSEQHEHPKGWSPSHYVLAAHMAQLHGAVTAYSHRMAFLVETHDRTHARWSAGPQLEALAQRAADHMADQQAMPDAGALVTLKAMIREAFELGRMT